MNQQQPSCHWLDKIQYPLVNKFYRAEGERGKVRGDDRCAVLKLTSGDIIAAVCIRQVGALSLLMSMAVAKEYRGRGNGRALLNGILHDFDNQTYTFSYAHLTKLYQSVGFHIRDEHEVPEILRQRFTSYKEQGRDIVAMQYMQTS